MATGQTTAGSGATTVSTIGSGVGGGPLLLCSILVGAAERGVRVRGLAWSSNGDRIEVDGVGAVLPDDGVSTSAGELFFQGHDNLSVSSGNRVDFAVAGTTGVTWRGWLEVELVYEYSA